MARFGLCLSLILPKICCLKCKQLRDTAGKPRIKLFFLKVCFDALVRIQPKKSCKYMGQLVNSLKKEGQCEIFSVHPFWKRCVITKC